MVIFCLHHEFPGLCKCVKQRNPFRVMDIAGTTSTRTTFMWNLQIHFSIWLNEKIQKPTIGIKYCQCLQPPLVYCQAGKAGKATGDCSSGIANTSNWCRKVYFFKLELLQQERHLPRHVCIASPLLRLVICIAPAKASYRQRAEGSFAKGCGTQGEGHKEKSSWNHGFLQEIDILFPLWFDIGLLLTYHDVC